MSRSTTDQGRADDRASVLPAALAGLAAGVLAAAAFAPSSSVVESPRSAPITTGGSARGADLAIPKRRASQGTESETDVRVPPREVAAPRVDGSPVDAEDALPVAGADPWSMRVGELRKHCVANVRTHGFPGGDRVTSGGFERGTPIYRWEERDIARAARSRDAAWETCRFSFIQVEGLPWVILGGDFDVPATAAESAEWWARSATRELEPEELDRLRGRLDAYDRTTSGLLGSAARALIRCAAGDRADRGPNERGVLLTLDGRLYRATSHHAPEVAGVLEEIESARRRRMDAIEEALR